MGVLKLDYCYKRTINYYETDKMGVVHHSNYIRFLEEARCRWIEVNNISMEKLEALGYTIPTLEIDCKYKYPVTSGDAILIEVKILEFNGVKMKIIYKVINKDTNKIIVEAWSTHCFTDRNLKPINIKKKNMEIYSIFESLVEKEK